MHGHVAPLPGTVVRGPKPGKCPTCGQDYERERTDKEHKLFFAVIREAFETWPDQYEHFTPTNEKHLRGWLLVEVGHKLVQNIDGPRNITIHTVATVRQLLVSLGSDETSLLGMRMFQTKTGIRIEVPKSIARSGPKKIGKREFEAVAQKVYELIETITGISVEECIKRAKYGAP